MAGVDVVHRRLHEDARRAAAARRGPQGQRVRNRQSVKTGQSEMISRCTQHVLSRPNAPLPSSAQRARHQFARPQFARKEFGRKERALRHRTSRRAPQRNSRANRVVKGQCVVTGPNVQCGQNVLSGQSGLANQNARLKPSAQNGSPGQSKVQS